jgi:hypothetical protein
MDLVLCARDANNGPDGYDPTGGLSSHLHSLLLDLELSAPPPHPEVSSITRCTAYTYVDPPPNMVLHRLHYNAPPRKWKRGEGATPTFSLFTKYQQTYPLSLVLLHRGRLHNRSAEALPTEIYRRNK